jgi:hypothetical protein
MKKTTILLFAVCLLVNDIRAQTTHSTTGKKPLGMSNSIAAGLTFPMGTYGRTHTAGLLLDYSRSSRRYGNDVYPDKAISFAINAGVSYNGGKSAPTAGYEFRYGGNLVIHAAAGIDYAPAMAVNIALLAGPVMNIYEGSVAAGLGVNLFWNYFISKTVAVGPGLTYRVQAKTDALWSGTIRASYAF